MPLLSLTQQPSSERNDTKQSQLFLRQNNSHIQVDFKTILYVEVSRNYTKIVTETDTITVRGKISDMIASLPKSEFLQVHKSFAIATTHIQSIKSNRIHIGKHIIPIGKLYKVNVNSLLK